MNAIACLQNQTLGHYTRYETVTLKNTVLAMEDLQLNTSGSTLVAIRNKYSQQKVHTLFASSSLTFKGVAKLTLNFNSLKK